MDFICNNFRIYLVYSKEMIIFAAKYYSQEEVIKAQKVEIENLRNLKDNLSKTP